jgi:hypothetical protein
MGFFTNLFRGAADEAASLGVSVHEVTHDLPHFTQPGNRFDHLERRECLRYSLPRSGASAPSNWSMIQRDKAHGAQFDNGWLLMSHDPSRQDPGSQLMDLLKRMARESDDGVLEFSATPHEVSILAERGGSRAWRRRLHNYLAELAKL